MTRTHYTALHIQTMWGTRKAAEYLQGAGITLEQALWMLLRKPSYPTPRSVQ